MRSMIMSFIVWALCVPARQGDGACSGGGRRVLGQMGSLGRWVHWADVGPRGGGGRLQPQPAGTRQRPVTRLRTL